MENNFENRVTISGTIISMDQTINYYPNPCVSFFLRTYRGGKAQKYDDIRIIVFNDEEFINRFSNGDRIMLYGELQSRNFTRDHYMVQPEIIDAVKHYIEIFEHPPVSKEINGGRKAILDWDLLIRAGFLNHVPLDSLYDLEGKRKREQNMLYQYVLDKDGLIFKETQHTSYEIVVYNYEKLDEPLDPRKGDTNKIQLTGHLMRKNLNYPGQHALLSMQVKTGGTYYDTPRVYYHNCILWGTAAEQWNQKANLNDFLRLNGRLQTRKFIRITKNSENENTELIWSTVEISCSSISLINYELHT